MLLAVVAAVGAALQHRTNHELDEKRDADGACRAAVRGENDVAAVRRLAHYWRHYWCCSVG